MGSIGDWTTPYCSSASRTLGNSTSVHCALFSELSIGSASSLHSHAVSQQDNVPCYKILHWTSTLASSSVIHQEQQSCLKLAPRWGFEVCGLFSQHNGGQQRLVVAQYFWGGSQIERGYCMLDAISCSWLCMWDYSYKHARRQLKYILCADS